MAKIENSMNYLLANEGGFTIDDGGPTMWGIVISDVAEFRGVPASSITEDDMRKLGVAEATAIYKKQYWDAMSLDSINDQNVATCIFDTGVNRGISIGAKYAQKTADAMGGSLNIDGKIGPLSIAGINACSRAAFIRRYESLVWSGYQAIVESNPGKYSIYLKGWDSRAQKLLTLI